MLRIAVAYFSTGLVFLACDAAWLTIAGPGLYKPEIGPLLADKVSLAPAAAFYLLYVAGLVYFAVWPGLTAASVQKALISAAVLGAVAYGAYDLTNMATLKLWSLKVTLCDLAWGAVASMIGSSAGFFITKALG